MKIEIRSIDFSGLQSGMVLLGLGLAGLVIARFFPQLTLMMPPCLFHSWSGWPCPSCGATQAGLLLSQADLTAALAANPLFTLLYLGMAVSGVRTLAGLITGRTIVLHRFPHKGGRAGRWLLLTLLLNWLYLLAHHQGIV